MSKNIHELIDSIDLKVAEFNKSAQVPARALPQRSSPFEFPMSQTEQESWTLPPEPPKPQATETAAKPTGEAAAPQLQPQPQPPAKKENLFARPTAKLPTRTTFQFPKGPEEVPEPEQPIVSKKSSRTRNFLLYKFSKKYDK
jgi:hypothetical protein